MFFVAYTCGSKDKVLYPKKPLRVRRNLKVLKLTVRQHLNVCVWVIIDERDHTDKVKMRNVVWDMLTM